MIDFQQFVRELGDFGKRYTDAQLQQLYLDAKRFAQIILEIHRADVEAGTRRFPQGAIDEYKDDPTIEK